LLKQYFKNQGVDKIHAARKVLQAGQLCPIETIGNSPQDKYMILKVLSNHDILAILKEILNEDRPDSNRHAGELPRRQARIFKTVRHQTDSTGEEATSSNPAG
tara:strand:+ start:2150 stop:2458 length:309 start_codon:yes stop_codon:yes gene_type:complete